jgi:hypothetical protein
VCIWKVLKIRSVCVGMLHTHPAFSFFCKPTALGVGSGTGGSKCIWRQVCPPVDV